MAVNEKTLDWIDRKLVTALQQDCKSTLQEMGAMVGLKPPSVMERIRKLEAAGIVQGYHAMVDPRKVGFDITAFIGVDIDYPSEIAGFNELLEDPQILECHHVTGRHTLLLKVRTRNTVDLEKLIRRIRSLDGVENSETTVVLSTWSERMYVPIEEGDEPPEGAKGRRRKR